MILFCGPHLLLCGPDYTVTIVLYDGACNSEHYDGACNSEYYDGACNSVHDQHYGRNSNMVSNVTMYIVGCIIFMCNRDTLNELYSIMLCEGTPCSKGRTLS